MAIALTHDGRIVTVCPSPPRLAILSDEGVVSGSISAWPMGMVSLKGREFAATGTRRLFRTQAYPALGARERGFVQ